MCAASKEVGTAHLNTLAAGVLLLRRLLWPSV